jgi:hypothetical protein
MREGRKEGRKEGSMDRRKNLRMGGSNDRLSNQYSRGPTEPATEA